MPNAKFEEGSEITVDSPTEVPAPGWTLGYTSVYRIGGLVALHVEATFAAAAAALVMTLGADFAPAGTVTSPDGKFTVAANGRISFVGSTAGGGTAVLDVNYTAGAVSP